MQIERILYPITTLGPGNRLVIWSIGCSKGCHMCANPELWSPNKAKEVDVYEIFAKITSVMQGERIDGVTITGGDPLEQIEELNTLVTLLRSVTDDILVYTGHTMDEVRDLINQNEFEDLKQKISVLIDGRYIDDLNDDDCVLRGSSNQKIHFFDETKKPSYMEYMNLGRMVQNVFYGKKMISVGIHSKEK